MYRYYEFIWREKLPSEDSIIVMLDGRMLHGGLSDRFWGLISTYKYCKDHNKTFKIFFTSPYKLEEFLLPNKVDWLISSDKLRYVFPIARPIYLSMVYYNREKMYKYATDIFAKKCNQLHLYTNMRAVRDAEFSNLFHELFKLSPTLEQSVKSFRKELGQDYVSITFRFQQLLGDFKEGDFPILSSDLEKESLIAKCIQLVKREVKNHNCRILVTSDSCTFLSRVAHIENVYIIPGKIVHIDYDANQETYKVHEKSFLDLFLISMANEIYLANFKPLYHSGFPMTAALIGGKIYHEISI